MKNKIRIISLLVAVFISVPVSAQTAEEWVNQQITQTRYLLQQIAAFQAYLGSVQKGYSIAHQGLATIGHGKGQERQAHTDYFSALKKVNPIIKKSTQVAAILSMGINIPKTCHRTLQQVKQTNQFTTGELDYIQDIMANLLREGAANIEDLRTVITPHQWEMTDEERLQRLDALYEAMLEKQALAQQLANEAKVLAIQRMKEKNTIKTSQSLYGF